VVFGLDDLPAPPVLEPWYKHPTETWWRGFRLMIGSHRQTPPLEKFAVCREKLLTGILIPTSYRGMLLDRLNIKTVWPDSEGAPKAMDRDSVAFAVLLT
jgi:hypothetical protein